MLLVGAVFSIAAHSAFRREVEQIAASGDPLALKDVRVDAVPADQNGAVSYRLAFDLLEGLSARDRKVLDNWPHAEGGALESLLARSDGIVEHLTEGAKRQRVLFVDDYSPGYHRLSLTHCPKMVLCARLLAARAALEARKGDVGGAVESCRLCHKLAEALLSEVIYDHGNPARWACDRAWLRVFEEEVFPSVGADHCREMLKDLDGYIEKGHSVWTIGWQVERAALLPEIRLLTRGEMGYKTFSSFMGVAPPPRGALQSVVLAIPPPLSVPLNKWAAAGFLRHWAILTDLQRQPYWQARPALTARDRELARLSVFQFLVKDLSPAGEPWARKQALHDTRIELCRLALALRVHKCDVGGYPNELEELVTTDILDGMPKDPFTGKAFRYFKEREGFLIYSLGENLAEDGGIPAQSDRLGLKGRRSGYVVWRCDR